MTKHARPKGGVNRPISTAMMVMMPNQIRSISKGHQHRHRERNGDQHDRSGVEYRAQNDDRDQIDRDQPPDSEPGTDDVGLHQIGNAGQRDHSRIEVGRD